MVGESNTRDTLYTNPLNPPRDYTHSQTKTHQTNTQKHNKQTYKNTQNKHLKQKKREMELYITVQRKPNHGFIERESERSEEMEFGNNFSKKKKKPIDMQSI